MASRKNIVKRKGIPLTIVSSSKRFRVQHIKAKARSEASDKEYVERINENEHLTDEGLSDVQFEQVNESHSYEPSSYTKRKQKAAERWECLRNVALDTVITSMGEPQMNCAACKDSAGIVMCFQCGPLSYYCENCAIEIHQNMLFHHCMEIWQVSYVCVILYSQKLSKKSKIQVTCKNLFLSKCQSLFSHFYIIWILKVFTLENFWLRIW